MLSISAIAASLSPPIASADGSLNPCPPGAPLDAPLGAPAGAGEGVAGAVVFDVPVEAAGAAGAEGVVDVWAGVEGAALFDAAAGTGFGWGVISISDLVDGAVSVGAQASPI